MLPEVVTHICVTKAYKCGISDLQVSFAKVLLAEDFVCKIVMLMRPSDGFFFKCPILWKLLLAEGKEEIYSFPREEKCFYCSELRQRLAIEFCLRALKLNGMGTVLESLE